jgi:hypothetical protein
MLVSFIFYLYHTLFNVQIILNKIPWKFFKIIYILYQWE